MSITIAFILVKLLETASVAQAGHELIAQPKMSPEVTILLVATSQMLGITEWMSDNMPQFIGAED